MIDIETQYRNSMIHVRGVDEAQASGEMIAARQAVDAFHDHRDEDHPAVDPDADQDAPPPTPQALGEYRCHKVVKAARILYLSVNHQGVATLTLALPDGSAKVVTTREGWTERFRGSSDDLGYYVEYEDGYTSWSPSEAFESGYRRIA